MVGRLYTDSKADRRSKVNEYSSYRGAIPFCLRLVPLKLISIFLTMSAAFKCLVGFSSIFLINSQVHL